VVAFAALSTMITLSAGFAGGAGGRPEAWTPVMRCRQADSGGVGWVTDGQLTPGHAGSSRSVRGPEPQGNHDAPSPSL
jgi:hypothetical protein